jgi:MoxR-like ATPase
VTTSDPTVREVAGRTREVLDQVEGVIVGKRSPLALILATILAGGHVLIEDLPGLAKTLTARLFAECLGLEMTRIQFTPDLLPSDVTGSSVYDQRAGDLEFRPGPVFANLVLGDEINRAPPKTQAALLEAMQEQQVSAEGTTMRLPAPFHVIATQNPIEYEGTYPLPEAQLDRFMTQVRFGYPGVADEVEILRRRAERARDDVHLDPISTAEEVVSLQRCLEAVHVADELLDYIARLVGATRNHPALDTGASPRGSLALMKVGRAWAAMGGRDFVTPDDVKALAVPVLAHRVIVKPEMWVQGVTATSAVTEALDAVATPQASEALRREA